MSVSVDFVAEDGTVSKATQVATNLGWATFGDWVDSLPLESYGEVVHFWEHGYEYELLDLAQQLVKAVQDTKPVEEVASVIKGLLHLLVSNKDAAAITVVDDG